MGADGRVNGEFSGGSGSAKYSGTMRRSIKISVFKGLMAISLALALIAGLAPADPAMAQRGGAHDRAREAYESGQVRSLGDILKGMRQQHVPGRMVDAELQNRRGQTIVPPYSVRPVSGARVSTPLDWDELEGDLDR